MRVTIFTILFYFILFLRINKEIIHLFTNITPVESLSERSFAECSKSMPICKWHNKFLLNNYRMRVTKFTNKYNYHKIKIVFS